MGVGLQEHSSCQGVEGPSRGDLVEAIMAAVNSGVPPLYYAQKLAFHLTFLFLQLLHPFFPFFLDVPSGLERGVDTIQMPVLWLSIPEHHLFSGPWPVMYLYHRVLQKKFVVLLTVALIYGHKHNYLAGG